MLIVKNYTLTSAATLDGFLDELRHSNDIEYNHFKIWTFNLISGWQNKLNADTNQLFKGDDRYALVLYFYLLTHFIKDNAAKTDLKLADFLKFVNDRTNDLFLLFGKHSWYCFLSVLDEGASGRAMTEKDSSKQCVFVVQILVIISQTEQQN